MRRISVAVTLLVAIAGCGEDKGYGAPIDNDGAEQQATFAVTNAGQLRATGSNDAPLLALNSISGSMSVLVNVKAQAQYEEYQQASGTVSRVVDEACVVITETEIRYTDCDFGGGSIDGTVLFDADSVEVDLDLSVSNPEDDFDSTVSMRGDVHVDDTKVRGWLDFDTTVHVEDLESTVDISGNYDVVLEDGCAVDGEIEVHAVSFAKSGSTTASQSFWVKAEFGPACGDVVIR